MEIKKKEQKKRLFGVLCMAAAAGAAAYGVYKFVDSLPQEDIPAEPVVTHPFEELIRNQTVMEELDGKTMKEWFASQPKGENQTFFLAKVTEKTAEMFELGPIPEALDREHTLLQAVVRQEDGGYQVVAVNMISFAESSEPLEELFGQRDYIAVTEDE